jgi:Tfp pilus assembly protein PilF
VSLRSSLRRTFPFRLSLALVLALAGCARTPAQQAAKFLSKGQALMEKKDYARAVLEFRNAESILPRNAEPHYQLGLAYLRSGDYRAGVAALLHAVELDPQHAGAQLELAELTSGTGSEDLGAGVWEAAEKRLRAILAVSPESGSLSPIKELQQLEARNPQDRDVKSRLVRAYMIERRFPEAEREIENLLEQIQARRKRQARVSFFQQLADRFLKPATKDVPEQSADDADQDQSDQQAGTTEDKTKEEQNQEDAAVLVQRAHLYLATGRARDAEQDLLRALHLNPHLALAHYLMSKVHQVHASERTRREELAEAVDFDPNWLAARLELARSRTEGGGARAAVELLADAPEAQQNNVALIAERNRALIALNDRIALRKSLDQGLAIAKTPDFLRQDGYLRMQMHDLAGSRRVLDAVLEQNPEDLLALETRSESYIVENHPDLALSTMREHVSRHPRSAGLQYLLGAWLMRLNHPEEARVAFRAAAQARPGFLAAMEKLVDLDLATNKPDVARQTLASLAAAPGGNAPAEITLGVLEERPGGNAESAIAHYRKALNVDPDNVTALNNLAYHLAGDKNHADEALSLALRVKKLDPANAYVDDTIGWAYYNKGSYSLAVQSFEAAVARQPNPSREYHLAMAYFKAGVAGKARATLRDALKMDASVPEASIAMQLIDQVSKAQP